MNKNDLDYVADEMDKAEQAKRAGQWIDAAFHYGEVLLSLNLLVEETANLIGHCYQRLAAEQGKGQGAA